MIGKIYTNYSYEVYHNMFIMDIILVNSVLLIFPTRRTRTHADSGMIVMANLPTTFPAKLVFIASTT